MAWTEAGQSPEQQASNCDNDGRQPTSYGQMVQPSIDSKDREREYHVEREGRDISQIASNRKRRRILYSGGHDVSTDVTGRRPEVATSEVSRSPPRKKRRGSSHSTAPGVLNYDEIRRPKAPSASMTRPAPQKKMGRPRNPETPRDENDKAIYYVRKGTNRGRKPKDQTANKTPQVSSLSRTSANASQATFGSLARGKDDSMDSLEAYRKHDTHFEAGAIIYDSSSSSEAQHSPEPQPGLRYGPESVPGPYPEPEPSPLRKQRKVAVSISPAEPAYEEVANDRVLSLWPRERRMAPHHNYLEGSPEEDTVIYDHGQLRSIFEGQPCEEDYGNFESELSMEVEWTGLDDLILRSTVSSHPSELSLWRIMRQRFGASTTELFRFGLWPEHGVTTLSDGTKSMHPYMNESLISKLRDLACHIAWGKNINVFRYVLMCAVQYRVLGHDEPLEPIVPLDDIIDKFGLSMADKALFAYRQTKMTGIGSRDDVKLICERLRDIVKPMVPRTEVEKSLFLLRADDAQNLIAALQSAWDANTMTKIWSSVSDYYDHWIEVGSKPFERDMWPRDGDHLIRLKRNHVIRCRREAHCRQILQQQDMERFLYDVSEANRQVTTRCFEDVHEGPTETQLSVIRGLIQPPSGPHMPAIAWRCDERSLTFRHEPESSQGRDHGLEYFEHAIEVSPPQHSTSRKTQKFKDRSAHAQTSGHEGVCPTKTPSRTDVCIEQTAMRMGGTPSLEDEPAYACGKGTTIEDWDKIYVHEENSRESNFANGDVSSDAYIRYVGMRPPFQKLSTPLSYMIRPPGATPYEGEDYTDVLMD